MTQSCKDTTMPSDFAHGRVGRIPQYPALSRNERSAGMKTLYAVLAFLADPRKELAFIRLDRRIRRQR